MTAPRQSLRGLRPTWLNASTDLVLDCLRSEYEQNGGWPVRVRRLAELSGFRTPSVIHTYLHRLAEAGLAEKGPGEKDGWRPVEGAE